MAATNKIDYPKAIEELCLGNKDATAFCYVFLAWTHLIDDAVDQDKTLDPELVVSVMLQVAMAFSLNPFFQQNKVTLLPIIAGAANTYADSISWALRADDKDRRASDVLKSAAENIYWEVARILGGFDHMADMTRKYRFYDYDHAA